jgi:stearoyl-CoA desaturase (delta-9 desaturase)
MNFGSTSTNINLLTIATAITSLVGLYNVSMFTWTNIVIMLVSFYVLNILGVWMTLHRYYSHKSFEFKNTHIKWFFTILSIIAGRGSPLGWVYVHRTHHKFADTTQDPHDPTTVGWKIFLPHLLKYGDTINKRLIVDLLSKTHVNINKYYLLLIVFWSVALLMISPTVFYFFYVIPFTLSYIALDLFVFLSHTYGYRNFETKDTSKNNWFISLILWCEGWHNNHHRYPGLYNTQIKWWEFDPLGRVIAIVKK